MIVSNSAFPVDADCPWAGTFPVFDFDPALDCAGAGAPGTDIIVGAAGLGVVTGSP